jgi:hypothetical protein
VNLRHVKSIAAGTALSAVLMLSVGYYWPIQEAYHPLNQDWNGCSRIATLNANTTLLLSYDKPLPNSTSLLAIIGPSVNFTERESSNIGKFLEDGGVVLLADDFGTGNSLLKELDVSARFSGKPLADLYYYSKNPDFPIITDFSPGTGTENLSAIVLDRPSYITIGNSSSVTGIGSSSPFSFIDLVGNGKPLTNETIDSYTVMATARFGSGMLLLVADPSMFINDMIGLYDNMRLFQNALKMGDSSVIFDTAHLAKALLTDWRIMLKESFDSLRLGKTGVYLPGVVVAVLALTFSFQLLREIRGWKHRKATVNIYTLPWLGFPTIW